MPPLYHSRKHLQRGIVTAALTAGFFVWCPSALAAEAQPQQSVRLDAATLQKGYTLQLPGGQLTVVVPGKSFDQAVTVTVEQVANPPAFPATLIAASSVWKIIVAPRAPEAALIMAKPLRLVVAQQSKTLYEKQVRIWNDAERRWKKAATTRQRKNGFDVQLGASSAVIGVFDNRTAVLGKASWFRHRRADAAASNDFPMGSTLKVTDQQTSRSVMVTVRSRGPFVPGRVIDMSTQSFRKLRPLAAGIANILVELVHG